MRALKSRRESHEKTAVYCIWFKFCFGTSVARTLAAAGNEVVAVDQDADRVAQIADDVSYAVQVDVADEDAMSGLGNGAYGWCSHCCC